MREILLAFLLLTLLIAGCIGGPSGHSGTGSVSASDVSSEDLSADDLSIDLADDETALPEQIN